MKRITQKEIALRAGISESLLSQIKRVEKRPSWKVAKRLAFATRTSPVLWLDGTSDEIKAALNIDQDGLRDFPERMSL